MTINLNEPLSDEQILEAIKTLSDESAAPVPSNDIGTSIVAPTPSRSVALQALLKQAEPIDDAPDPLLVAAMQQQAAPVFAPQTATAMQPIHRQSWIKKLAGDFLSGAGAAMMHSAGLRTPEEEKLLQQEIELRQRGQATREYEADIQAQRYADLSEQEKSELEFRRKQFQVAAADKGFKFDPESGTLEEMSESEQAHWQLRRGDLDEAKLAVFAAMGDEAAATALSLLRPPKPAHQPSTYAEMALAYEQESDPTIKAELGRAMEHMDKRERERAMLQRPESESDHDRKLRRDSTIYAADQLAQQGGNTAQAIAGLLSQLKDPRVKNNPDIYERVSAALMLLRKEDLLKQATNAAMTQGANAPKK